MKLMKNGGATAHQTQLSATTKASIPPTASRPLELGHATATLLTAVFPRDQNAAGKRNVS